MAENTKIEWTDATWNPITGCSVVSPGCTNCYAMKLAGTRMRNHPSRAGLTQPSKAGPVWTGEVRFNEQWLDQPLRWRKPRMIFVCAHGDLFHENVPDEWIDMVFAVMALAQQHTFQVLTKRPERMREYIAKLAAQSPCEFAGTIARSLAVIGMHGDVEANGDFPNVWLGTSIEDQATADARIPHLMATPAAVRFVSAEPLIGPVDLTQCPHDDALAGYAPDANGDRHKINWVIVGGESGKNARPMHPDWARSLRDQCGVAGVPFFFKQWGEWHPCQWADDGPWYPMPGHAPFNSWEAPVFDQNSHAGWNWRRIGKARAGRLLDGREWNQMPEAGQ
jgi:protein gp37